MLVTLFLISTLIIPTPWDSLAARKFRHRRRARIEQRQKEIDRLERELRLGTPWEPDPDRAVVYREDAYCAAPPEPPPDPYAGAPYFTSQEMEVKCDGCRCGLPIRTNGDDPPGTHRFVGYWVENVPLCLHCAACAGIRR